MYPSNKTSVSTDQWTLIESKDKTVTEDLLPVARADRTMERHFRSALDAARSHSAIICTYMFRLESDMQHKTRVLSTAMRGETSTGDAVD